MATERLTCIVCGSEITENMEEWSIVFCSPKCRSMYRPDEKGVHMELKE